MVWYTRGMSFLQPPLAYHLTWSTYGTRLHGDERGTVDLAHNRPGTPFLPEDPVLESGARLLLTRAPFVMDDRHRPIVEAAIRDHCAIRQWLIHALNVRTNHVHIVVEANSHSPEQTMAQLKSWGTRRLTSAGLVERGDKLWTDHGSTRWLNDEKGLWAAIEYVQECQ